MLGIFLIIAVSSALAFGKRLPWSVLPYDLGRVFWIFVCLFLVVALFYRPLQKKLNEQAEHILQSRLWFTTLILLIAVYQLLNFQMFRQFGYQFPWPQLVLCGTALIFLRPGNIKLSFGLHLALLATSIFTFPDHVFRSDMLSAINKAFSMLTGGTSPYAPMLLDNGCRQMPYLPLTFFSHAPGWYLGIDLRWNEFFYRAVWMGLLTWRTRSLDPKSPWLLAAQTLALHPYFIFRHELYFDFFLILIVAYWFFPKARMFFLPLMVVSRQWIWVISPFLLWKQIQETGWKKAILEGIGYSVLSLGGLFLLLRPTTDIATLINGAFGGFQEILRIKDWPRDYGLTLVPVFQWLGLSSHLQMFQAGIAVLLLGWVILKRPSGTLQFGIAAWVLFLMLNGHFWTYFWISPMVFLVALGITENKTISDI